MSTSANTEAAPVVTSVEIPKRRFVLLNIFQLLEKIESIPTLLEIEELRSLYMLTKKEREEINSPGCRSCKKATVYKQLTAKYMDHIVSFFNNYITNEEKLKVFSILKIDELVIFHRYQGSSSVEKFVISNPTT